MSEGVSRAKAVLPVDPNSSQGREKVGMPPALLARPTGLENDLVPREQTFEQAAALCPAVWRAAIHPAAELEAAQDAQMPPYPASTAGLRASQSPGLEANSRLFGKKGGIFLPCVAFPPPWAVSHPHVRAAQPGAGGRAGARLCVLHRDAAQPHAKGLPALCQWSRTRSSLVSAGCLDLPSALVLSGYCIVLWHLSSFHHAVLVSSVQLVLDLRSQ